MCSGIGWQVTEQVFWLSGKAEIGIWNHPLLEQYLIPKNGNSTVNKAAFFCIEQGTVLQKSGGGLLRSMLLQVFSQREELLRVVFDSYSCNDDRHRPSIPLKK